MQDFDAFISYAEENLIPVSDVVLFLKEIGIEVWFDRHRVRPGPLVRRIREAGKHSQWFILFASTHAEKSSWVADELDWFLAKRSVNDVVVVELEEGPTLPSRLAQAGAPRAIPLWKNFLDGLAQLAQYLAPDRKGILTFFPRRQDVKDSLWDLLYKRVDRELCLMGHSMARAVDRNFREVRNQLLAAVGERGVSARIVLLAPDLSGLQQAQEVQSGLDAAVNLPNKIETTVEDIRQLKRELASQGASARLAVRCTRRIMYSSVGVFDSLALITNYCNRGDIGNASPTFLVSRTGTTDTEDLFATYRREFEHYWDEADHPEEVRRSQRFNAATRIVTRKHHVQQIQEWVKDRHKAPLPPPAEMIIYPTYRCSWPAGNPERLCPDCMYKGMHTDPEPDLELGRLCQIMREAIDRGIHGFEFSGGGEPLQYPDFRGLLEFVGSLRATHAQVRFGLLTNGMYMTDEYAEAIAANFSYVRFSYAEGTRGRANFEEEFAKNVGAFLGRVTRETKPLSVGLKLLVNSQNAERILGDLRGLRHRLGNNFLRFDHIRIKAMRSERTGVELSPADARKFRREFFEEIFVERDDWPENVQVDLDLRFVNQDRFHCQLSPLWAIVDPKAALLACCNYNRAYEQLKIGSLRTEPLESLWGSRRHHEILQALAVRQVCNAHSGSPCRFVEYHGVLWPGRDPTPYVPAAVSEFV